MPRFIKTIAKPEGAPPGTLVLVGEQRTGPVRIRLIDYDASHLEERELATIADAFPLRDLPTVTWINIDGIHDIDLIQRMGRHFGIHALTLEDIVNTGHRPKFEDFDTYVYLVFKMLSYDPATMHIRSEQISLIVGPHYVISFQEAVGDMFDPVRTRIHQEKGRLRQRGCGYLAYALLDAVVDHYFTVLEAIGEKIEALEGDITDEPGSDTLRAIHRLKREMIFFRKQVWPMREIVSSLIRSESDLVSMSNEAYLADVYDHTVQVLDTVESFRDVLSSMLDLYMSTISNRMNEVMKVLTIIATIFIPITFVAGIYGMNFKFMPELEWKWGYVAVWGVIAVIALAMVAYFRRKKWL
ncbi:Magnesium and cobalt transport protein CorA [Olavius algarvensis associated proteobacterium Delta 3]|nr:Magnesium and cobalt transport protein CorA [Olavius algarvensis associated proteobacterium Delta 3]